jgi:acetate kinase
LTKRLLSWLATPGTAGGRDGKCAALTSMSDAIAVINAGSSSVVLTVSRARWRPPLEVRGQVEGLSTSPRLVVRDSSGRTVAEQSWGEQVRLGHDDAVEHLMGFLREYLAGDRLVGVGHRVVHGGLDYTAPVRVDASVLKALEQLVPLAPLHQPHSLSPIAALLERAPELPQVVCFDTAFHRTNPDVAQRFALPPELHDAGVRRYGFHGLSYEYIASVLARFDAPGAAGKTIAIWATARRARLRDGKCAALRPAPRA